MTTTTLNRPGLHSAPGVADSLGSRLASWLGLAPARPLTRTEEAAALRAMASRLQDSEASFASDLYAAADRHEQLG